MYQTRENETRPETFKVMFFDPTGDVLLSEVKMDRDGLATFAGLFGLRGLSAWVRDCVTFGDTTSAVGTGGARVVVWSQP